jgi:peroxiredoxin
MIMKKKALIIVPGLALLMVVPGLFAQTIGEKAPDFTYADLEGTSHSLSQYSGKVVFLFVFGNACPYCIDIGDETEVKINQVFSKHQDFQALGLDTWPNSTTATVGSFRQQTGITYPLLLGAGNFEQLYSTSYDRLLVIDRQGILRHKNNTLTARNDLDNAISVLEELFSATGVLQSYGKKDGIISLYPNPSRDRTVLQFTTIGSGSVKISLLNQLGQEVRSIVDRELPSGNYKKNIFVSDLSPGIYFIQMITGGKTTTRKLLVSR